MFTSYYIQFIIYQSYNYSEKDLPKMLGKVKEEVELIQTFYTSVCNQREAKAQREHLDHLVKLFECPTEDLVVHIIQTRLLLKKDFNDKCLQCVFKARHDISTELKGTIRDVLAKEEAKIREAEKKASLKLLTKNLLSEYIIRRYVDRFRARYSEKQDTLRKKQDDKQNKTILKASQNEVERLKLEQEAINMTAYMGLYRSPIQNEKMAQATLATLKSRTFSEVFVSFKDDIIMFQDRQLAVLEKISQVTIKSIAAVDQNYVAIQTARVLYVLETQDQNIRTQWIKSALYLRQESIHELQPTVFEKYTLADVQVLLFGRRAEILGDLPMRPSRLQL